ncbi:histidine kinase dimerization/phosphoacceptor domain -containing protein [Maribacter sp. 2-571]|uniref:tetratricopeptide repeat-containing sensor histidine kinase n=1 Tax=Maribacter sp. 2-571 TaxID=3417569 RepID=UPI003D32E32B
MRKQYLIIKLIAIVLFCLPKTGISQTNEMTAALIREQLDKVSTKKIDSFSAFMIIAKAYNNIQNDSAIIYLNKSYDLLADSLNTEKAHRVLSEHARYLGVRREFEKSAKFGRSMLGIARSLKDPDILFQSYQFMGTTMLSLKKSDSAEFYFKKATKLLPKVDQNNFDALGKYYRTYGWLQRWNNQLDAALEYYIQALQYFEKSNNIYALCNTYNSIGAIFLKMNRINKAIESLDKALVYANRTKAPLQNYLCTQNLSGCYFYLEDEPKSLKYALASLDFAKQMKIDFYIVQSFETLAAIYAETGDFDKAIMYNYNALAFHEKKENHGKYVFTLQNLSIAYIRLNDFEKARINALKALELSKKHKVILEQPYIYELLSELDSIQGKPLEALMHYKLSIKIADSIKEENVNQNIDRLQVKYRTLEKEKEIEKLNSANNAQKLKIKGQRYENLISWSVSGISLLIITAVFFLFRTKQRNNRLLEKKNAEIQHKNEDLSEKSIALKKALDEKDVLLKEIHHRVKNNLQLVSSLLNLQANTHESEQLDDFVARSHNRIASMALVHEVLYKSNRIKNVPFNEYLKELVSAVYQSFDFSNKDIRYEIYATDTVFNLDTTVPVGIVVNELVHNAFKHAFNDQKKGMLTVRFKAENGAHKISVRDNGKGMNLTDTCFDKSYGLRLVKILIRQLRGSITYTTDKGTWFIVRFAPKKESSFARL